MRVWVIVKSGADVDEMGGEGIVSVYGSQEAAQKALHVIAESVVEEFNAEGNGDDDLTLDDIEYEPGAVVCDYEYSVAWYLVEKEVRA